MIQCSSSEASETRKKVAPEVAINHSRLICRRHKSRVNELSTNSSGEKTRSGNSSSRFVRLYTYIWNRVQCVVQVKVGWEPTLRVVRNCVPLELNEGTQRFQRWLSIRGGKKKNKPLERNEWRTKSTKKKARQMESEYDGSRGKKVRNKEIKWERVTLEWKKRRIIKHRWRNTDGKHGDFFSGVDLCIWQARGRPGEYSYPVPYVFGVAAMRLSLHLSLSISLSLTPLSLTPLSLSLSLSLSFMTAWPVFSTLHPSRNYSTYTACRGCYFFFLRSLN